MSKPARISFFERLSIRQRIFGGFAVMLLLLAGLATLSHLAIVRMHGEADRVQGATQIASVVQAFGRQAELARGFASNYAFSESESDLQTARQSLKTMEMAAVPLGTVTTSDPTLKKKLTEIVEAQRAFAASLSTSFEAVGQRRQHNAELNRSGTDLRVLSSAINRAIQRDQQAVAVLGMGSRLNDAVAAASVGATSFVSSRNPNDAAIARTESQRARSLVKPLKDGTADDKRSQRFLAAIEEPLGRFDGATNGLVKATADFASAARAQDTAARALFAATADVNKLTGSAQNEAIESTVATALQAERTGIITSLIALALGVALAWLIGSSITRPLNTLTGVMHRLAAGDLETAIPATHPTTELGRMTQAVQVFRDAGLDKIRLEGEATTQRAETESERAQTEAERAASAREQSSVVGAVASGLEMLSAGDLTFRIESPFAPAYEKLRTDFNAAMEKLQETMYTITANTNGISTGANEISSAASDLARRTEQQAATLEQTSAALDEITATVRETAQGAENIRSIVIDARGDAEVSSRVVTSAVEAMSNIERSSGKITQIIGTIDEIAFQTNLLALNAGVEAARAGDSGRGFAVVATEVRNLAQRTAEAAKEVKTLIRVSSEQVTSGVDLVGQTGQALSRIIGHVTNITSLVGDMASSTREQATALGEVNTAVNQMDQVTQQNAAMVEESTAASETLAREAINLAAMVGRFQVGSQTSDHHVPDHAPRCHRYAA